MTTDTMRAEFEAKFAKPMALDIRRLRKAPDMYKSGETQFAWAVWQASAEAQREKCAKIADDHGTWTSTVVARKIRARKETQP